MWDEKFELETASWTERLWNWQIDHLGLKVFLVKLDKLKVNEFGDDDNDEWDMMKMC